MSVNNSVKSVGFLERKFRLLVQNSNKILDHQRGLNEIIVHRNSYRIMTVIYLFIDYLALYKIVCFGYI